ncbi:retrovirus-related pol polyprotein from transposon TNT 1-94 [Tanacetum coccineum]
MHYTNVNLEYKSANKALTTELDRYKEEVKDLKEMQNVENSFSESNEQYAEIVRLKGQSAQTVHMMTKSKICYDHSTKQAIGFEKPFYLKKVRESKPKLYDGNVILKMDTIVIPDSDETLMRCEESPVANDIVNTVVDLSVINGCENMNECQKCLQLETELLNKKDFIDKRKEQGLVIAALKNELRKLKGKDVDKEAIETHSVDLNVSKDNMEPITPKLLNKRTAHSSYIKHTQEEALVLRDIVEHVKANYPQDSLLESAFRYTKVIQDLLSHISRSCPSINNFGPQLVEVTPRKKDKKVRFVHIVLGIWTPVAQAHDPEIAIRLTNLHQTWDNLFSVGQFCDSNLKVAFRQHTCFIRNLEGVDLLTGSRGDNLYTLSLGNMMASITIFQFEKDHLSSACALGKSSKKPHKPKSEDTNQEKLYLLHMDLCGPMRVTSVNGKKYILVIVDDYSRFTWVKCLRSKDEAPAFIINFLKMIQVWLKETVRRIRTDNGTEFVNQTLREYYEKVGISHETSVARSLQQNGVVERRNRTLIEAARTMLIYAKSPLFLWAEAVATAYYTQNHSMIRHAFTKLVGLMSMQEELHEFKRLEVWKLVPPPDKVFVITLKWI